MLWFLSSTIGRIYTLAGHLEPSSIILCLQPPPLGACCNHEMKLGTIYKNPSKNELEASILKEKYFNIFPHKTQRSMKVRSVLLKVIIQNTTQKS